MYFKDHECKASQRSVTKFLVEMIAVLGLAFHPDNEAEEYIFLDGNDTPVFTPEEREIINKNLKTAHHVFGEAIYDKCNMLIRGFKQIHNI